MDNVHVDHIRLCTLGALKDILGYIYILGYARIIEDSACISCTGMW